MTQLSAKFDRALAFHQAGQIAHARILYQEILEAQPAHFDALHLLGVIASQTGDPRAAIECISQALAIDPGNAAAHFNRAAALQELGQLEDALAGYDRALEHDAEFAEAYCNRAMVLKDLERWEDALANCDRAIALRADFAEAHFNRGVVLRELGRQHDALASYDAALAVRADYAEAHFNRGIVFYELGRLLDALASYDLAIAMRAGYVAAHANRGNVLSELGHWEEAVASYDLALTIRPDAVIYSNRGNALKALQRWEGALASYDRSIERDGTFAEAHLNRADTLRELRHYEGAIAGYERAIELNPALRAARGLLLHAKMHIGDWTGLDAQIAELVRRIELGEPASDPFCFLALSGSARLQHRVADLWVRHERLPAVSLPPIGGREGRHKIRIGYFSADFCEHAVSILTAELFEIHDRTRFEVVAFSLGPEVRDEMQQRLRSAFDQFIEVHRQSDEDIALLARRMAVDIAIDLGGHTAGRRPGIFALRAAPLQVSYLGYAGTSGAAFMDYLVADHVVIPDHCRRFYSEKIIYLPHSYLVNDRKRRIADKTFTRAELGLPPIGFVFCCFNHSYKITPEVFDGWMEILKRVEGSVLWLSFANEAAVRNLRRRAVDRGVDAERIVFAQRLDAASEHLARLRAADLFLDTLPYNAHSTAADALWAGLPVLTCIGEAFSSRVAASLLSAVGLPELVAPTRPQYEQMAVDLAHDAPRLSELKARLAANRLTFPLFDTPRCAAHLEAAYTRIQDRGDAGLPPSDLIVGLA